MEEPMSKEKILLRATLCFLRRDHEVLLALKKKKIGEGCLNGYGGGIEEGEDEKASAVRELLEEAEVIAIPEDLQKIAIVYFHNITSSGISFTCECHVYALWRWRGEPKTTKEMTDPEWFSQDKLPFERLMLADRFWLPIALGNRKIIAVVHYGPYQSELLRPVQIWDVEHF